jgi:hypothetical protein
MLRPVLWSALDVALIFYEAYSVGGGGGCDGRCCGRAMIRLPLSNYWRHFIKPLCFAQVFSVINFI